MQAMQRAKHYAEISAAVFFLLTVATVLMLVTGPARAFFLGELHTAPVAFVAIAFATAGVGLLVRREWGYYWALAVAGGFCAGGLTQLVAMDRAAIPTLLVGILLVLCLMRASRWYPHRVSARYSSTYSGVTPYDRLDATT